MTIKEKKYNSANHTRLTLYKEGLFYKCYNEDAMVFVKRVKQYKVSSKFIKNVGETAYSIGFLVSAVEKGNLTLAFISEKIDASNFEVSGSQVVFNLEKSEVKSNYKNNENYWSSSVSSTNARNLNFNSSDANMNTNNRANGNSVRCLKDYILERKSFI